MQYLTDGEYRSFGEKFKELIREEQLNALAEVKFSSSTLKKYKRKCNLIEEGTRSIPEESLQILNERPHIDNEKPRKVSHSEIIIYSVEQL